MAEIHNKSLTACIKNALNAANGATSYTLKFESPEMEFQDNDYFKLSTYAGVMIEIHQPAKVWFIFNNQETYSHSFAKKNENNLQNTGLIGAYPSNDDIEEIASQKALAQFQKYKLENDLNEARRNLDAAQKENKDLRELLEAKKTELSEAKKYYEDLFEEMNEEHETEINELQGKLKNDELLQGVTLKIVDKIQPEMLTQMVRTAASSKTLRGFLNISDEDAKGLQGISDKNPHEGLIVPNSKIKLHLDKLYNHLAAELSANQFGTVYKLVGTMSKQENIPYIPKMMRILEQIKQHNKSQENEHQENNHNPD